MSQPTVFAIIPTFNRLHHTRSCVEELRAQTYVPLEIVVSDGGSTDGSRASIRREFPSVTVLGGEEELWWTGAMDRGMDHALRRGKVEHDFLLMMNNDTHIPVDFVEKLVAAQKEHGGAVGALAVDHADPQKIISAGLRIDWSCYAFCEKTRLAPREHYYEVDVLPGRGTLLPLSIVQAVGKVDAKRFPHYIADYEFFARAKRAGYSLGVTYRTKIACMPEVGGLSLEQKEHGPLQRLKLLGHRRSKSNIIDHYRFIDVAAPEQFRGRLKRWVLARLARVLLETFGVYGGIRLLHRSTYHVGRALRPPPFVTRQECELRQLSASDLVRQQILMTSDSPEHFIFTMRTSRLRAADAPVQELYEQAKKKGQRVPRLCRTPQTWR